LITRAVLVAVLALAGAAHAETPLIAFAFGEDALQAGPEQVLRAEAVVDEFGAPGLHVKLVPELDAETARLTAAHVGEQGSFRICGRAVTEPILRTPLERAEFVLSASADEVRRLEALLKAGNCDLPAGD
jgi:hypothetical protein